MEKDNDRNGRESAVWSENPTTKSTKTKLQLPNKIMERKKSNKNVGHRVTNKRLRRRERRITRKFRESCVNHFEESAYIFFMGIGHWTSSIFFRFFFVFTCSMTTNHIAFFSYDFQCKKNAVHVHTCAKLQHRIVACCIFVLLLLLFCSPLVCVFANNEWKIKSGPVYLLNFSNQNSWWTIISGNVYDFFLTFHYWYSILIACYHRSYIPNERCRWEKNDNRNRNSDLN